MNKHLAILISILLLSSCATILNNKIQRIQITADKKINNIRLDSSLKHITENEAFYVLRNKKPLTVYFKADSTEQTLKIKSKNSFAFWINLYFNYGIGMIIDKNKPERYAYPKHIYLDYKNGIIKPTRFAPVEKGTISINFSMPYVNGFYVRSIDSYYANAGFMGIAGGVDYYFKKNRYICANFGGAINSIVPVPAAVDYRGERQTAGVTFFNLRDNYCIGRFDLSYGINLSKSNWSKSNNSDSLFHRQRFSSTGLGLSLSTQFKVGQHFRLGAFYQPNFIQFTHGPILEYQHHMSIELVWKFNLLINREPQIN